MRYELSEEKMKSCFGGAVSWLVILCIAGGAAAVFKLIFSGRGSMSIGPFKATWGK